MLWVEVMRGQFLSYRMPIGFLFTRTESSVILYCFDWQMNDSCGGVMIVLWALGGYFEREISCLTSVSDFTPERLYTHTYTHHLLIMLYVNP